MTGVTRRLAWRWFLVICVFWQAGSVLAKSPPSARPEMLAPQLGSAPAIDGAVIGDAAWQGVIPATGFWQVQPYDGEPATQDTEVYVGYLDDALYIAVIAYDNQPGAITVTDSRRDANLDDTDSFQIIIDGLLDRQNGYVFGTNPAGLAYDGQVVREGSGGQLGSGAGGFAPCVTGKARHKPGASIFSATSGAITRLPTGRHCRVREISTAFRRPERSQASCLRHKKI